MQSQNWESVLEYLKPKPPPYAPEAPSMQQQVFLRTNALEALFGGAAGGGKGQCTTTPIVTPMGYKMLGDLKVGDRVTNPEGGASTVIAVTKKGVQPCYRLTFSDGATTVTDADHLWRYRLSGKRVKRDIDWKIATTPQMKVFTDKAIEAKFNGTRPEWALIPLCEPTQHTRAYRNIEATFPIDSYVLGVLLGDGSMGGNSNKSISFASADEEIVAYVQNWVEANEMSLTFSPPYNYRFKTGHAGPIPSKLWQTLEQLGVTHCADAKAIPEQYFTAPLAYRQDILRGLFDTDGTVDDRGHASYTSISKELALGVQRLLWSLGHKATLTSKIGSYVNKQGVRIECQRAYTVTATGRCAKELFRLTRKRDRCLEPQQPGIRRLVLVEPVEPQETVCITVDHPNGLYICEDSHIVTHNSSALLMAALQFVDVPGYNAMLFRRTLADLTLPGALMDRFRDWIAPYDDIRWNSNTMQATFPSGARISFGYLNNKDDYLRYKGPCNPSTDVLTCSGWKPIAEVQVGDMVASMNPETREWDYQAVVKLWEYDHDGPLYSPRAGSDVSFSVTGDHTWWASTQRVKTLKKYRTDELPKVARFPQAAHFVGGIDPGVALFPRSAGGRQLSKDLVFTAEDWATLLGWYIAEGCTSGSAVHIALHDSHSRVHKDAIKDLLGRSGAHVYDNARYLQFTNGKLAAWLNEHTGKGAHNKRIPDEVFIWNAQYARLLLESLVEGDGTWRSPTSAHYVTVSRELADGVMRLAQHCGFRATLDERHDRTTTPDGKQHDVVAFHVYLLHCADRDTSISLSIDNRPIITEHYAGKVYCLTVPPHHTFLSRHNGRVVWTGNSELQFIGMDEVSEIRETDYRYLFSRLRRPSSGPLSRVPLRMRSGSNPAPNWVRQRFIVEGREHGRIFVPSKLSDNPGIDAASYRKSLEALDPVERRRLEEGDWWVTSLGSLFQREDFIVIDPLEVPSMVGKTARLVRFWDFAATEVSQSNSDPDWTVGTLALFDEGLTYIIDVRRARVRPDKVEHLVAQTAYEDGPAVAIRFEVEPGSAGKMVADQFARFVVPGYDVMGIRATGDKETRARPFASAVANGLVRVVRASWLTEWLDEFSAFPEACPHDDQVDSAVGAYTYLTGLGLPQRKRATIIV